MELKRFEAMWDSAEKYTWFIQQMAKNAGGGTSDIEAELRIRDNLLRDFQSVASPQNVRELYELATHLQQQVIKLAQGLEDKIQALEADKPLFSSAKGPRIPAMKNVIAVVHAIPPAVSSRPSIIQLPQGEHVYINGVGMRVLPYNATLAAIERAGHTATEAPL